MAPAEFGAQPWNQRVSPRGVKWRKEVIIMLELEPKPVSMPMPDMAWALTNGRRAVKRTVRVDVAIGRDRAALFYGTPLVVGKVS
jgi:hypothetical protein